MSHSTNMTFFFFNSVLCPFQDYFSSYEMGQSVGGAKMGEPREKPPDTPASRTWLVSHVARAGLEPTPDTAVNMTFVTDFCKYFGEIGSWIWHVKSADY